MGAVRAVVFRVGVVAALVGALALAAVTPAQAAAVGGIATPAGTAVSSTSSRVVVSWDGTTETIDLSLGLSASAGTLGLVLPTPAKAAVGAGDASLFDIAERAIAPVQHREDDWWGRTSGAVAPAASIEQSPLGAVEPTSIKATNRSALSKWLKKNGLQLTAADRAQVADYASRGWSLSLLAVTSADAVQGALAPVRVRFATKQPILPMRLAASGKKPMSLRVYSLADHRTALRVAGSTRNLNAAQSVVWAGAVTAPELRSRGAYLTVTDVRFDSPEAQVTGDIGIVDAQADDTLIPSVVVYSPITLLGLPLGWLLVVWGGIGAVLAIAYLINRFRSQ